MLENTRKVSTAELVQMIVTTALIKQTNGKQGIPGFVYGRAGGGKSSAFYQAADQIAAITGEPCIVADVRAMLYDPTEIRGQQTIDQDSDYAKALKPEWFRGLPFDGWVLVVFEEATKAPNATQNALYQPILDRRIGVHDMGPKWIPYTTGNLQSSKSGDLPMPGALRSRGWSAICDNSPTEWLNNWAYANGVHPFVTTFVKANPDKWLSWDASENPLVYSCERSLAMFSDVCHAVDDPTPFAIPFLGESTGRLMSTHIDLFSRLPDPDLILSTPSTAPVVSDIGTAFYVASMVGHYARPEHMDAITTYARRHPHEVATVMVTEAVRRNPSCKETAAYIKFRCDYDPNQI